jgi:hypothetical protein
MKLKFNHPIVLDGIHYHPGIHEVPDKFEGHWFIEQAKKVGHLEHHEHEEKVSEPKQIDEEKSEKIDKESPIEDEKSEAQENESSKPKRGRGSRKLKSEEATKE